MKYLLLIAAFASATCLAGCQTTTSTGTGNQEAKRRAALEQRRQQTPPDEAEANLRAAQQDLINRDGNPMRAY